MADYPWIVTPAVSAAVGIVAVILTQRLTRDREDRTRLLAQGRETAAGALTAYRDYLIAKLEKESAEALSHAAGVLLNESRPSITDLEARRRELAEAVNTGDLMKRAEIDRKIGVARPLVEAVRVDAKNYLQRLTEKSEALARAEYDVNHWIGLIQLTFSPAVLAEYMRLVKSAPQSQGEMQPAFVEAVKRDLERHYSPRTLSTILEERLKTLPGGESR